jgi:hypothetical protein
MKPASRPDFSFIGHSAIRGDAERMRDRDQVSRNDTAAECCRQALFCLDVAERMSIREERARMMQMAQQWLALAEDAEAKEG